MKRKSAREESGCACANTVCMPCTAHAHMNACVLAYAHMQKALCMQCVVPTQCHFCSSQGQCFLTTVKEDHARFIKECAEGWWHHVPATATGSAASAAAASSGPATDTEQWLAPDASEGHATGSGTIRRFVKVVYQSHR